MNEPLSHGDTDSLSNHSNRDSIDMAYVSDRAGWALDEVSSEMRLVIPGKEVSLRQSFGLSGRTKRFFMSPDLFLGAQKFSRLRQAAGFGFLNYFHGLPSESSKFESRMDALMEKKAKILGIRCTNATTETFIKSVELSDNVISIPLGVNLKDHRIATSKERHEFRKRYGIAENCVLIGSFQKDGNGWGLGLEPKFEKGPDVLCETVRQLQSQGFQVHVLLSGPSRGYVVNQLEKFDVPHTYLGSVDRDRNKELYSFLDIYLVSSRSEGGPRALLESLASGVPVVTTDVGQASTVLTDKKVARIVSQNRPDLLASEIVSLVEGWRHEAHSTLARKHSEKFSIYNFETQWLKFLNPVHGSI